MAETNNAGELAAEARDAAIMNFRAGNHEAARTHALMAIMHLMSLSATPIRVLVADADHADAAQEMVAAMQTMAGPWWESPGNAVQLPSAQGVYRSVIGTPWFRSAVETERPWLDITRGHMSAYEERWFTEEEASHYAPFVPMGAVR